jgi:hypothetical protein
MKRKVLHLLNPMLLPSEKLPNLLFITVLVFLQSILFIPLAGQNGISTFQSIPNHNEVSDKRDLNRQSSFSFLKVFFQLNNSFRNSDQHEIVWLQIQFKYSQKADQSLLFLRFSDHLKPSLSRLNILHSNLDDNFFLQA